MRKDTQLYIGGLPCDIDQEGLILFTYQAEELTNPTIVKNSYSQSITLPATPANNKIFGDFFRPDRKTQGGGGMGVQFNALNKAPFILYDTLGRVLESGYAKLESTERKGAELYAYNVALYGGLGAFLYDWSYASNGEKATLADIIYPDPSNSLSTIDPYNETMRISAQSVKDAWDDLADGDSTFYQLVNFAPMYEGVPENFDANKAVYKTGHSGNLYTNTPDGYAPLTAANGNILLEMENAHTALEMGDLRAYLQRPVLRWKYLLQAFALASNTGVYSFALDQDFFAASNPYYEDTWLALPLADRDLDFSQFEMSELLKGTASPAEYLIEYAKALGLMFSVDSGARKITLMSRDKFYAVQSAEVVDLTKRIQLGDTLTINPYTIDARYYEFSNETIGAFADEYKGRYGRVYGTMVVDTAYEFDASKKAVLEGSILKGGADAMEGSNCYLDFGDAADSQTGVYTRYSFKPAQVEGVQWKLYKEVGDQQGCKDCTPTPISAEPLYWNTTHFLDFMARPQAHDKTGKGLDASNMMLFYCGMVSVPSQTTGGYTISEAQIHLSDDNPAMFVFSDKPCWEASTSGTNIEELCQLPSFRRQLVQSGNMRGTLDWGDPKETALPLETYATNKNLYAYRWQAYLTDRLDIDTKVMRCKVDLSGLKVDGSLLRRFFFYANSLWVLNKIENYSLTTHDLTDCEFVKVKDASAYTSGQKTLSPYALYADRSSLSWNNAGGQQSFIVHAESQTWTATSVPSWVSLSASSGGSGDTTIVATASTATEDRSADLVITGSTEGSITLHLLQSSQVFEMSVMPNGMDFLAEGTYGDVQLTTNDSWTLTTPGWITASPTSGSGSSVITLTAGANTTHSSRSAVVNITGGHNTSAVIYVSQFAPDYFEINGNQGRWPVSGYETATPEGYGTAVVITSSKPFVAKTYDACVVSPANGSTFPSSQGIAVAIVIEPNTSGSSRSSKVDFVDADDNVLGTYYWSQAAAEMISFNLMTDSYGVLTLTDNATGDTWTSANGTTTAVSAMKAHNFTLRAEMDNPYEQYYGYQQTAAAYDFWSRVLSAVTGEVGYVEDTYSGVELDAHAQGDYIGLASFSPYLYIDSMPISIDAGGGIMSAGSYYRNVDADGYLDWKVASKPDWLEASPMTGSGNNTISFEAKPCGGNSRSGSVVVSDYYGYITSMVMVSQDEGFAVKLKDTAGDPIIGALVIFSRGGSVIFSGTTNSEGACIFTTAQRQTATSYQADCTITAAGYVTWQKNFNQWSSIASNGNGISAVTMEN